jgi:uncharacterized protein YjbI with pentapeptide repeats
MNNDRLKLIDAVMTSSDDFCALVRASGLDPAQSFRDADLADVDFGDADLTAFSFHGAVLDGADLSKSQVSKDALFGASLVGTKLPPQFADDPILTGWVDVDIAVPRRLKLWFTGRSPLVMRQFCQAYFLLPAPIVETSVDRYRRSPNFPGSRINLEKAEKRFAIKCRFETTRTVLDYCDQLGDEFFNYLFHLVVRADLRRNYSISKTSIFFERF